jgi:hypothetical protein
VSARNPRKKAPILPKVGDGSTTATKDRAFVGIWKDREDMKDPVAYIRKMREPRYTWDDALGVVQSER